MKHFYFALLCLASVPMATAQHGCDGSRYIDDVFGTPDVQLGVTYATANTTLKVDIYTPPADVVTDRPLVILAFGGSFMTGTRDQMDPYCQSFARKGYVTATIDYRLDPATMVLGDSLDIKQVVVRAMNDMRAAVRFFKESHDNGNPYGIDPDLIFVGGMSSGAFCALHTAYLTSMAEVPADILPIVNSNGGLEGNSSTNGASYNSQVAGVINMAGAIDEVSLISAGDPPLISMHSDGDQTVPYLHDQPLNGGASGNVPYTYGSGLIHPAAQAAGVWSQLFMIPDADVADPNHGEVFQVQANYDTLVKYASIMMESITCTGFPPPVGLEEGTLDLSIYPNPATDMIVVETAGVNGRLSIGLFNQLGERVMLVDHDTHGRLDIDVTALEAGIYFLQVDEVATGRMSVEKVIIQ